MVGVPAGLVACRKILAAFQTGVMQQTFDSESYAVQVGAPVGLVVLAQDFPGFIVQSALADVLPYKVGTLIAGNLPESSRQPAAVSFRHGIERPQKLLAGCLKFGSAVGTQGDGFAGNVELFHRVRKVLDGLLLVGVPFLLVLFGLEVRVGLVEYVIVLGRQLLSGLFGRHFIDGGLQLRL